MVKKKDREAWKEEEVSGEGRCEGSGLERRGMTED